MSKRFYIIAAICLFSCCIGWFAVATLRQAAPVPGWEKFGGTTADSRRVELWLPKHYESLDPKLAIFGASEATEPRGGDYSLFAASTGGPQTVLWAQDTREDNSSSTVTVNYAVFPSAPPPANSVLEGILAQLAVLLPDEGFQVEVLELGTIPHDDYEAGRLVYELSAEDVAIRQVHYILIDGNDVWDVVFTPSTEELDFDEYLPMSEQSIQTFKAHH